MLMLISKIKGSTFCCSMDIQTFVKIVCHIFVFSSIVMQFEYRKTDRNSCKKLLHEGRLRYGNIWQPTGCMIHQYTTQEARSCMIKRAIVYNQTNHLTFIGDSRIRQQYRAMVGLLKGNGLIYRKTKTNLYYREKAINMYLEFRWKPLPQEVVTYFRNWESLYNNSNSNINLPEIGTGGYFMDSDKVSHRNTTSRPDFVLVGFGLHMLAGFTMRQTNMQYEVKMSKSTDLYQNYVKRLCSLFAKYQQSNILWMMQDPLNETDLKARVNQDRAFFTTDNVNSYNHQAEKILRKSKIQFWNSNNKIAQHFLTNTYNSDGIHLNEIPLHLDRNILMNYLCNNITDFSDGKCCKKTGLDDTSLHVMTLWAITLLICILVTAVLNYWKNNVLLETKYPCVNRIVSRVAAHYGNQDQNNKQNLNPKKSQNHKKLIHNEIQQDQQILYHYNELDNNNKNRNYQSHNHQFQDLNCVVESSIKRDLYYQGNHGIAEVKMDHLHDKMSTKMAGKVDNNVELLNETNCDSHCNMAGKVDNNVELLHETNNDSHCNMAEKVDKNVELLNEKNSDSYCNMAGKVDTYEQLLNESKGDSHCNMAEKLDNNEELLNKTNGYSDCNIARDTTLHRSDYFHQSCCKILSKSFAYTFVNQIYKTFRHTVKTEQNNNLLKTQSGESNLLKNDLLVDIAANRTTQTASAFPSVFMHFVEFCNLICKVGVIMFYFYICDRSGVIMQENKVYNQAELYISIVILLVIGLLSIRKSSGGTLLHRDQTDEWKGWMQLIILVYHYTGASKDLSVYMYVRILVSSYVFLTGYGHTMFCLTKMDTKTPLFYRAAMVIFRLNFLTVCLCVTMGTEYQYYYFVPLVSFWFLVVYGLSVLAYYVRRHLKLEGNYGLLVTFLILTKGLIVLIYFINTNQSLFSTIFKWKPIKPLFELGSSGVKEWQFRWSLDRYSAIYGMLFAVFIVYISNKLSQKKSHSESTVTEENHTIPLYNKNVVRIIAAILCVCGLLVYSLISGRLCTSKSECNHLHTFATVIPMLSYITLRNIHPVFRIYHSVFFAWVGKISLELFICQYHIWLAAETKGILVLIPGYPIINVIVTSLVFVCVATEINDITQKFSDYFIPKCEKKILFNMFLILLMYIVYKLLRQGGYAY